MFLSLPSAQAEEALCIAGRRPAAPRGLKLGSHRALKVLTFAGTPYEPNLIAHAVGRECDAFDRWLRREQGAAGGCKKEDYHSRERPVCRRRRDDAVDGQASAARAPQPSPLFLGGPFPKHCCRTLHLDLYLRKSGKL